ncbi:MAG: outer membrane beta-barrel protein [Terriglobales bacterium]
MRLSKIFIASVLLFAVGIPAFAQQDYVGRSDVYGGFAFLSTPKLNLFERGFHGQGGFNLNRWLALGFDFSTFDGHSSLFPNMLNAATQAKLAPYLGLLPPGYTLYVPYNVRTYTFAGGPQLNYRHFKQVTFFIHPSLGAMHQDTTARAKDPIQTAIVGGLLGPTAKTSDTVVFYGVGGGIDLNVHKHLSFKLHTDFVHTKLYSGLLNGGENNIRFSVGPVFHFGKNVAK